MKDNASICVNLILATAILCLIVFTQRRDEQREQWNKAKVTEQHLCDGKVYTLTLPRFATLAELEKACKQAQKKDIGYDRK